jgi:hypothetical protein
MLHPRLHPRETGPRETSSSARSSLSRAHSSREPRTASEYACYSGRASRETLEAPDPRGTKSLGIITAGRKIPGKCRARCPAAGLTDGKRDFHPGTRRLRQNASFFAPSGKLSMHEACRVINLSHAITGGRRNPREINVRGLALYVELQDKRE